jgi:hypothetical protein
MEFASFFLFSFPVRAELVEALFFSQEGKEQPFDRLRANGVGSS